MTIYLASDHRGFALKQAIAGKLQAEGYQLIDLGAVTHDPDDDYVDYTQKLASILDSAEDRGVLLCGSGQGMVMAANRFRHLRAALGYSQTAARKSREDEDVNVLALPADELDPGTALSILNIFLTTPFSGAERHLRRIEKLENL